MAIEIYSYTPADPGSMFPAIKNELKLVAVAPLEQREKVEIWCSEKNKEADEAGISRHYQYDITAVEIWS
jgi:hypothetical protein